MPDAAGPVNRMAQCSACGLLGLLFRRRHDVGLPLSVCPQHPCMEQDKVSGSFASDRDGFDWVRVQSGLTLSQVRLRLGLQICSAGFMAYVRVVFPPL